MLLAFALAAALHTQGMAQEASPPTEVPTSPVDALAPEPEAATPPVAQPVPADEPAPAAEPETPAAPMVIDGRELDCAKYHFEIMVDEIDGKKARPQSLKLCGYKGSTKVSWLRTLRDVRMKVAGSDELTTASKTRVDSEIAAEIARVLAED